MPDQPIRCWRTKNEIDFLSKLGFHSKGRFPRNPKMCIAGYIKGAALRDDWGLVDRDEVLNHARAMLASM